MKVLLDHNPLAPSNSAPVDFGAAFRTRPAWITTQQAPSQSQFQSPSQAHSQAMPAVTAYRLQFELPEAALIRVHVSADERYLFYVDGQVVGRGPERGSDRAWFYESYDLTLAAAPHTLVALVWQLGDPSLTRATIYFTHYVFETYRMLEQPAAFFARLGLWFALPAQGFKTTPEQPEPSRSDCHGWGAHPLHHFFATLLGIRPAAPGFDQVEIKPMPGHVAELAGAMVHPRGQIAVDLHFTPGHVRGSVLLPEGLHGTFCYGGKTIKLRPGTQAVDL